MKRNMEQWIEGLISAPRRAALPIMTYPGLPLAGLRVMDAISDGEAQFACLRALAGRYPMPAALTLMDLSVEAEAFGSPVKFSEDEVPTVCGRIITDEADAAALAIPEVGAGRTGVYLKAAELAAAHFKDKPVFGGQIGPFSLAARLCDMTEIMLALMLNPAMVHQVLEKCTRFLIEYARAFKRTGAGGVVIAEPAAGLLGEAQCSEFSSAYVKRIVEAVQDEHFIVILHNCGRTTGLVGSMASTGARGLHFGNAVDMAEILALAPGDVLVMGNIDPSGSFRHGTPEAMREKTLTLLERTEGYDNFVLSSGCDIPPGTPLENVEAFFAALAQYNEEREVCREDGAEKPTSEVCA